MFKNLRTSTKLLLLCGMFVISIAVTTAALVAEKQLAIAFAHKELVGSRYLAIVRDTYPAILIQPGDPSFALPKPSPDEILKALAAAEADAPSGLQTAELEQALAETLRKLWSDKSVQNADRLVLEALSNEHKLASRIGDDSNLALDPDLDTYHLQNIVVARFPGLVSQLGEMQALLRAAKAKGSLSNEHMARLVFLDSSIRSTVDAVKSDLAAADRGNADGSLRRNVNAAIATMIASVDSYLGTANAVHLGGEITRLDPAALERAFSSAVGSIVKGWGVAQTDLNRLLQQRISDLVGKLGLSLTLIGVLAGLSILLAIMTHRHIVSSLEHLEGIVAKVGKSKTFNVVRDRDVNDEFNSLTVAFNDMLAELAAAREREIGDQARTAQQTLLTTMGQMAASITHELNQPLAAIVTNGNAGLRWLAKATPDFDEVRAALQRIVSDGHRASQLIGTIRSMFKKDGQKKAPVDVNQLIQEVLGLMQGELQNQQVSLQTELEAQPIQVSGDRVQLQQVILNLITNAIDAMGSVTEHPRVLRVRSETDESDAVVITVEDSGAGIDPKGSDRIFDMFYTTKSHGMGIGLAISRSIIEAHGGCISASSGNPHGSVFQVVLPTCELRAA
jgi:C4-dicarboxylate-specific signal transduction histidine kinase